MRKLWLVARQEYLNQVKKKSFLLTVFGIPLFLIILFAIIILVTVMDLDKRPLGYVDQAGVIIQPESVLSDSTTRMTLRAYQDEEGAQAALAAQEIQAYYLLPSDYLHRQQAELYYWDEKPDSIVTKRFADFLRANLIAAEPDAVRDRLTEGVNLSVHSVDGQRELSNDNPLGILLPYFAGILLFFSISITGGYLLQAVVEEKESRTMEILITSLSPEELIGGKTVGLTCVALTQLCAWGLPVLIGIPVAMRFIPALSAVQVPWDFLIIIGCYLPPTFALTAGLMVAIGATVPEVQQGQQIASIVNLLFIVPIFFATLVFERPDAPFLIGLTLFPTTSFVTLLMRWGTTVIPWWQLLLSWLLVSASAIGSVWLAARIFRLGMLQYGQRLTLKRIVAGLRDPALAGGQDA